LLVKQVGFFIQSPFFLPKLLEYVIVNLRFASNQEGGAMKKIMVVLAILFFASPAFAQDYQIYGLQPYQFFQLDQSSLPPQPIDFYEFNKVVQPQQQPQVYSPRTVQHSHKQNITISPNLPVTTK
jgi:hypothetical protein